MKEDKNSEKYLSRLKKIIGKKIDTTMIYPLSQFESVFGDLWGNGIDESRLTRDQLIMRKRWKECREKILDMGNRQKRNASAELDMYTVVWNKYQAVFLPVEKYKEYKEQEEKNEQRI